MVPYRSPGRCFQNHQSQKGPFLAPILCTVLLLVRPLLVWSIPISEASPAVAHEDDRHPVRYIVLETYGDPGDAWNVFCYSAVHNKNTFGMRRRAEPHQDELGCCQALRRALGQPARERDNEGFPRLEQDESIETIHEKCLKEVTAFPDSSSSFVPSLAFFLGRSNLDNVSHQQTANREHTFGWRRFFPAPVPSLSVLSNIYVWDNERGQWLDPPTTTVVVGEEEEEEKNNDDPRAVFWQDWQDWHTEQQAGLDDTAGGWTAHLQSQLSSSGGMHRELHHCITVEFTGEQQHRPNSSSSTTTRLSFLMVIQIPSGLFVNVEDLFRIETPGVSVQLIGPRDRVIDQEEPAFVSPPHGLLVHIAMEYHPASFSSPVAVEFVTLLHVRYPLPISRNEPDASSFRLVVLAPPRLLNGRVLYNDDDDNDDDGARPDETVRILLSRRGRCITPLDAEDPRPRLLSLWVAAGREEDYDFTLGVTLLVAVLGAMVMLRDISQLALWDGTHYALR